MTKFLAAGPRALRSREGRCAGVQESHGLPASGNCFFEKVIGLFEISAATGIQVQICLNVGDPGQGPVVPCIEEYALIIRVDEAKAWDSFGRWAVAELTELRVILFRKEKNIDSIHIDKGSIGRRCRCGERVG